MTCRDEDELADRRPPPAGSAGPIAPAREDGHHTESGARTVAMAIWVAAAVAWSATIGIPNDALTVLITLWLGTIAWNVGAPWRHHLAFLRDWSVPALLLTAYFFSRGWIDEFDITVHWTMPIDADRWLFGGTTPTETLQQSWCGDPCRLESPTQWFEVGFTMVYATHFLVGLVLAVLLWVRDRAEWLVWMRRYIGLNFAGLAIYITYPMAPPWLASDEGYLGHVERLTSRGWGDLGIHRANVVLNGVGNPVAAMPSLHAGTAILVALYGIWRLRSAWRWLLVLYPAVMCVALVYFGEHYVIDLIAGGLLAGLVMQLARAWERRHPASPPRIEDTPESDHPLPGVALAGRADRSPRRAADVPTSRRKASP